MRKKKTNQEAFTDGVRSLRLAPNPKVPDRTTRDGKKYDRRGYRTLTVYVPKSEADIVDRVGKENGLSKSQFFRACLRAVFDVKE